MTCFRLQLGFCTEECSERRLLAIELRPTVCMAGMAGSIVQQPSLGLPAGGIGALLMGISENK